MPKTLELPPQERKLDEPEEKASGDLTLRGSISRGPEKRNAIGIYLEGIEKREESIYRLGDNDEFTDPDGIDVVDLIPGNIKQVLFGDFIEQKLEEADRFKSKYEYKGLPTRYPFPNNQRLMEQLQMEKKRNRENMPSDYLVYKKGNIEVLPDTGVKRGIVALFSTGYPMIHYKPEGKGKSAFNRFFSDPAGRKSIVEEIAGVQHPEVFSRVRIWNEKERGHKYLGIDIEGGFAKHTRGGRWFPAEIPNPKEISGNFMEENDEFIANPNLFLERTYSGEFKGEEITRRENAFVSYWKTEFKHLTPSQTRFGSKWNPDFQEISFQMYPGQQDELISGLGVGILEKTINEAKEHNYDGVTAYPAYFHVAENLEKQGFSFENMKAQERLEMIKTALRAMDEARYQKTINEALAKGYSRGDAIKEAEKSLLTPQEKSWIVLLNSLKNKKLIPSEFHIAGILLEKLTSEKEKLEARLKIDQEMVEEIARRQQVGEFQRIQDWEKRLRGGKVLEFFGSRMIMDFGELKSPEFIQEYLDQLIENEIITGDTLNPHGSYIERLVKPEIKKELPYIVVYHMYDQDGFVEQQNGSTAKRLNIEYFQRIKKEIESAPGLKIRVEKAQGNVRNPGPNASYGWASEEPSVWTDELRGIERATQNVLVVECPTIKEVEKVAGYLSNVGHKIVENDTHTDPAWYVPDIRIFGLRNIDLRSLSPDSSLAKNYGQAVLHIKDGKDGYASTITHESHRLISGYKHIPVFIHKAMDNFIKKDEEKRGEYEFISR